MEKIVTQTLLYDFYGALLTDHQRTIYEDVVFGDLSLSEAAEDAGISRQGVHDILKRCTKAMEEYEEKLGLIAQHQNILRKTEEIGRLSEKARTADPERTEVLERISALAREIAEEV
ncbi:MAG: DNA-binding protein [Lachnospiraceae bacterium]|nr:DNA-binding protein [Lachnospiraceae bacterium]